MNKMKMMWYKAYLPIRYFSKVKRFKQKISSFPKAVNVVLSCETPEQCDSAIRYLRNYRIMLTNGEDEDNPFIAGHKIVLSKLVEYLQDTNMHSVNNFHYTFDGQLIKHWPDLNDYTKEFINVKFTKSWSRGSRNAIMGN